MIEKVYSMLGLAQKANKLVSGDEICEMTIKSKKSFLVIIAKDASEKTRKKFIDMSNFRNIKCLIFGEKEKIGNCIGKEIRSVVVIKDINFAKKVEELITATDEQNGGGVIGQKST